MEIFCLLVSIGCAAYAAAYRWRYNMERIKCHTLIAAGNDVAAQNKTLSDEMAKLRGNIQERNLRVRELESALLKAANSGLR